MYKKDSALNNLQWLICRKTKPNPIYLISMCKKDLALNNLQGLIGHKTQPTQIIYILIYMYKKDLALNNLQWLIYHKTQPNNLELYKNFRDTYLHGNKLFKVILFKCKKEIEFRVLLTISYFMNNVITVIFIPTAHLRYFHQWNLP